MLILMKPDVLREDVGKVKGKIQSLGFRSHEIPGAQRIAIGITGNKGRIDPDLFKSMSGVLDAVPVSKPFKLVSREVKHEDTVVRVGPDEIGGRVLTVIAGPCSVESRGQILEIASILRDKRETLLRAS